MRVITRIATATAAATAFAGLSLAGAAPALACPGTELGVNHYGVCVEQRRTTVGGVPVWTPGVASRPVNTPGVLFVPPQTFGTPYVPPQGVTPPTFTVDGVWVTPCLGSC